MTTEHTDVSTSVSDSSGPPNDTDHTTQAEDNHVDHTFHVEDTNAAENSPAENKHVDHTDTDVEKDLNAGELPDDCRSTSIEYTTPTDSVDELQRLDYCDTLVRKANLEDLPTCEDGSEAQKHAIEWRFDDRILTYARKELAAEGLPPGHDEWPITSGYVLALTLRRARGDGYREFADHLNDMGATSGLVDLDGGQSKSALCDRSGRLSDDQQELIKEAATRAVHRAYRAGIRFPEEVKEHYAADDDPLSPIKPGLQADIESGELENVSDRDYERTLDNWVEWFINDCLLPAIDLDRANPSYPVAAVIGLFAHASIQGGSLRDAAKTAGRNVGHDLVPAETTVMDPIRELSVRSIDEMFQDARASFFDEAAKYGVFEESKLIAFDLTDVPRFGPETDDPWVKGNATIPKGNIDPDDADQKWEYGLLALADSELYFAIGLFPFGNDLDKADTLTRTLYPAVRDIDLKVEKLIMDRGLYAAKFVQRCRDQVGDNWMMLVPSHKVYDFHANATKGEFEFIDSDNVDILKDLDQPPNVVVVPLYEWESNTDTSHFVFITDLPEDEVDFEELEQIQKKTRLKTFKQNYKARDHVEDTIGRIKDKFDIPQNKNTSTEYRLFTLELAHLFYNLWVFVRTCRSPTYAYPLGADERRAPSANQVLQAIRNIAFEIAKDEMDTQ